MTIHQLIRRDDPSGEVRPLWWYLGSRHVAGRGLISGRRQLAGLHPPGTQLQPRNPTYPYQNPVYPPDMPIPEMEVMARQVSMARAQSPGERVCLIDEAFSLENPGHTHPFDECMNYRHDHVVGDDEPWTYWQLLDQVVTRYMASPPPPPPPPVDWNARARVNPSGISVMDGTSQGWQNFTWATMIGASKISLGPGSQTRVKLQGLCQFQAIYIGPILAPDKPFVASAVYQLTFNGGKGAAVPSPPDYVITTDPIPHGFDLPNGVMIYGYISDVAPGQPTAYLGHRTSEPDWYSRWAFGDWSGHVNLMDPYYWVAAPFGSLAVLEFDAFY